MKDRRRSTVNCNNLSLMISMLDFVQWTVIVTTKYQVNHFITQEHALQAKELMLLWPEVCSWMNSWNVGDARNFLYSLEHCIGTSISLYHTTCAWSAYWSRAPSSIDSTYCCHLSLQVKPIITSIVRLWSLSCVLVGHNSITKDRWRSTVSCIASILY